MSLCDYDLFTKVKEPLRGARYSTRDELIRAIGRSLRNINKDGRAGGVRRRPNIWQKVMSTAVEQRACHAAGIGSIPAQDKFPGLGFYGFYHL